MPTGETVVPTKSSVNGVPATTLLVPRLAFPSYETRRGAVVQKFAGSDWSVQFPAYSPTKRATNPQFRQVGQALYSAPAPSGSHASRRAPFSLPGARARRPPARDNRVASRAVPDGVPAVAAS